MLFQFHGARHCGVRRGRTLESFLTRLAPYSPAIPRSRRKNWFCKGGARVSWLLVVGRKNARKLTKQEAQMCALCCECQR